MEDKIKVLVVDDSLFMRQALTKILTTEDITVIGVAKNGKEGVEKVKELKPDVVTMDIEMPVMTGIEALKIIMNENPVPVLMISTLTTEGADATIDALSLGAVDFIGKKPAFKEMEGLKDEIISKIRVIGSNSNLKNRIIRKRLLQQMGKTEKDEHETKPTLPSRLRRNIQTEGDAYYVTGRKRPSPDSIKAIGIGISTGGPMSLTEVLLRLPPQIPVPLLIAQHMPPFFTKSLAARLNSLSHINVHEAQDNEKALPGHAYLAPGGMQMLLNKKMKINISIKPENSLYKPSVNVMFKSIVESVGSGMVAFIMTGMGNDGVEGLIKLQQNGGFAIAQDVNTCVVGGMPKSALEAKVIDEIQPLNNIAETIAGLFGLKALEPKIIPKTFF